jgi:hypothetical protein
MLPFSRERPLLCKSRKCAFVIFETTTDFSWCLLFCSMFETLWIEFYSDILVKSWAHNQSDTKRRLEVTDSQYSNILTPWNDQKLLLSKTSSTKRYKFSGLEWILHFNSKTISSWCYLLNCSMDTIAGRDIIPYVVVLPWIVCSAINISSSCWASNVVPTSGCCCWFFPPWSPNGSELVQEILCFRSPWTQYAFLHCICHHITSHNYAKLLNPT